MDTKTASLIGNIVKIVVAIAGAVLCFLIMANSADIQAGNSQGFVDGALTVTYIGMAICVGLAVLFGLFYFLGNIGKSKGMLFGLVGLLIVAFISYSLADGNAAAKLMEQYDEGTITLSGAGIFLTLIMLAIGVVAALLSEVSKVFK